MRELCPRVAEQFEFFKRTSVENIGTIEEEELLRRLRSEQSTLCIMNNRKRVQSIYHQLNGNGVYHLSTYMYPEHRKRILAEIRARLKEKKKCIVIATSLVEAGVDLDFDTVYRELAGIDSVVQAAGRCNREGKRPLEDSKTYVFQLAKKMFLPTELKQPMEIAKIVAEQFENIASLEAIQKYFELLHYIKGDELDKKRILEQFEKGAKTGNYPFASVAAEFRLIEAKTRMIVIGKEEKACELAERLRLGERSRTLLREAGHYSIQVYENDFEKLRAAGDLEELDQEVALLRSLDKYSEESGMNMDVEFGAAVFL